MKKIVMFLLAGIMAFSLAACGGGSSENKDEKLKKDILDATDEAYSGTTAVDGSMYFLLSSSGNFAVLVLEGKSESTYIRFIGNATKDNDIITVTDQDSGNKFSFKAEAQGDGYFLDCGNMGECYVSPSPAEDVVDYIFITFDEMKDVTNEVLAEISSQPQPDADADASDDEEGYEEEGSYEEEEDGANEEEVAADEEEVDDTEEE